MAPTIASRLADVRRSVERAATTADRNPADITLIAVSKTQPSECLTEAISAGVFDLGENRVQEGRIKKAGCLRRSPMAFDRPPPTEQGQSGS